MSYRLGTYASFRSPWRQCWTVCPGRAAPRAHHAGPTTTRLALLDAWAVGADVLTFYQERIANEGYLRTATERLSVLELARAIGYELGPGVAASAYLAFIVENAPGAPSSADSQGTKVQSIPGQDQLPQTFETMEKLEARVAWNKLKPQTSSRVPFGVATANSIFKARRRT